MINGKNGEEQSREERKYERGEGIKKKLSEKENDWVPCTLEVESACEGVEIIKTKHDWLQRAGIKWEDDVWEEEKEEEKVGEEKKEKEVKAADEGKKLGREGGAPGSQCGHVQRMRWGRGIEGEEEKDEDGKEGIPPCAKCPHVVDIASSSVAVGVLPVIM